MQKSLTNLTNRGRDSKHGRHNIKSKLCFLENDITKSFCRYNNFVFSLFSGKRLFYLTILRTFLHAVSLLLLITA